MSDIKRAVREANRFADREIRKATMFRHRVGDTFAARVYGLLFSPTVVSACGWVGLFVLGGVVGVYVNG